MKTNVPMLCLSCRKVESHIEYAEERTFMYNGIETEYVENGYICGVCGEEQQTDAQFDDSMAQIREDFFIKTGKKS